ncbi:MAG: hypothetical protein IKL40_05430, partial [Clostridia bacterium]|nr:hypothetical protein [Clostridia bacterium]
SSVSRIRIMTKRREDKIGTLMSCEPGGEVVLNDVGCPDGTTVIVEELFANVPARRKFLKKDTTEGMAIANVVEKLALSRPDIAFSFISDDVQKFSTPGDGKLSNAIYALYGRDYTKKMTEVEWLTEGVEIKGYIGNPDNTKANRNHQIFFVNDRFVRNKTMSAALEQAYDSYIPETKFPCCVLRIYVHPAFVDANVHPTKAEVKFSDEKQIFGAIYATVRGTLERKLDRPEYLSNIASTSVMNDTVTDMKKEGRDIINAFTPIKDSEEEKKKPRPENIAFTNEMEKRPAFDLFSQDGSFSYGSTTDVPINNNTADSVQMKKPDVIFELDESFDDFGIKSDNKPIEHNTKNQETDIFMPIEADTKIGEDNNGQKVIPDTSFDSGYSGRESSPSGKYTYENESEQTELPFYRIVGEVFYSYVFVELRDRVLVVDKHAAHERIIFEELKRNMKKAKNVLQFLLVPIKITLSSEELGVTDEYKDEISAIGFEFDGSEKSGEVNIYAIPTGLDVDGAIELFTSVISRLLEGTGLAELSKEIMFEKALYQASCKAAVKAGRADADEDIKALIEKLLVLPDIKYCPHGRPVAFEITKDNLEKQFKRK